MGLIDLLKPENISKAVNFGKTVAGAAKKGGTAKQKGRAVLNSLKKQQQAKKKRVPVRKAATALPAITPDPLRYEHLFSKPKKPVPAPSKIMPSTAMTMTIFGHTFPTLYVIGGTVLTVAVSALTYHHFKKR